jgi:type IV/VI secretion system ImpK/VasF family protein
MNQAYADYVYPVITRGLQIKDQLERGEEPDLDATQRELVHLLDQGVEGIHRSDLLGDGQEWLGLRYALACWLDEIFIVGSPWESRWTPRALEVTLYATRDRAFKFPIQSEIALRTRNTDVVEAFFLCWLLGFRGRLRDNLEKLSRDHIEPARRAIGKALTSEWEAPPQREPRSYVPPLSGLERYYKMILIWIATALPLVIAIVVVFFHFYRGQ